MEIRSKNKKKRKLLYTFLKFKGTPWKIRAQLFSRFNAIQSNSCRASKISWWLQLTRPRSIGFISISKRCLINEIWCHEVHCMVLALNKPKMRCTHKILKWPLNSQLQKHGNTQAQWWKPNIRPCYTRQFFLQLATQRWRIKNLSSCRGDVTRKQLVSQRCEK